MADPAHYRYRQVLHRRVLRVESRVFCLRCPEALPDVDHAEAVIRAHVACLHGLDPDAPGGWARGSRYGCLGTAPARGIPKPQPPAKRSWAGQLGDRRRHRRRRPRAIKHRGTMR